MKIGFIGAGRIGTAMGAYLSKIIILEGYYSRSLVSAKKATEQTKSKLFTDLLTLINAVDLIAITTPDDQIIETVNQLIELETNWNEKIVFHMSGVHSSELLTALKHKGATVFSLHPMISINEPVKAIENLGKAFFTIEGRGKRLTEVRELLAKLDNPLLEIAGKDKELYHAAACIVSNYLVTLLDSGIQLLKEIGFTEDKAIKLIEPLVKQTLDNVINSSGEQALTGPISRGDIGTVNKHLLELEKQDRLLLEFYKILGKQTVRLAERAGKINQESAIALEGILK